MAAPQSPRCELTPGPEPTLSQAETAETSFSALMTMLTSSESPLSSLSGMTPSSIMRALGATRGRWPSHSPSRSASGSPALTPPAPFSPAPAAAYTHNPYSLCGEGLGTWQEPVRRTRATLETVETGLSPCGVEVPPSAEHQLPTGDEGFPSYSSESLGYPPAFNEDGFYPVSPAAARPEQLLLPPPVVLPFFVPIPVPIAVPGPENAQFIHPTGGPVRFDFEAGNHLAPAPYQPRCSFNDRRLVKRLVEAGLEQGQGVLDVAALFEKVRAIPVVWRARPPELTNRGDLARLVLWLGFDKDVMISKGHSKPETKVPRGVSAFAVATLLGCVEQVLQEQPTVFASDLLVLYPQLTSLGLDNPAVVARLLRYHRPEAYSVKYVILPPPYRPSPAAEPAGLTSAS